MGRSKEYGESFGVIRSAKEESIIPETFLFADIQKKAGELGIAELGAVPASEAQTWRIFAAWTESGQAGEMQWLTNRKDARRHPDSILPGVKTLFAGILPLRSIWETEQRTLPAVSPATPCGTVNPYAVCTDYHILFRKKLRELAEWLSERFPEAKFRAAVDTAPLLEKEWAARAGLGTVAKNSLLLHPAYGTEFFLGFLLTTLPFETFSGVPARAVPSDPCSGCDRCRRACPTGALNPDRTLNAVKCLNYWQIEYRGADYPEEIREKIGSRLFGCDACRRVCPYNGSIPPRPAVPAVLTEKEFLELFAGTPVERMGYGKWRAASLFSGDGS